MADAAVQETAHEAEVVVIGAGLSGVAAAITLRQAGFADVVVLEKSDRLGGSWRDNTYPGCGCDVPSLLYEYSFAPGPWTRSFATQPEILNYLDATAATHGVERTIRYRTEVHGGSWDSHSGRWHLQTSAGPYITRAVIVATGPWNQPRYPDLPGLEGFPGPAFHSARWDHTVHLTDRRVAVIGNAASTVQFLPDLRRHAARVDIFQSTAPWVLPKPDYALPEPVRRLLHRRPAVRRLARGLNHWTQEAIGLALRHPWLLPPLEAAARLHLRRSVPDPELRQMLTPSHRLGARRLLASDTYYRTVAEPNVHLHPTRAARIDGHTIVGADGRQVHADLVILATGFRIGELSIARDLYGLDGRPLADTWRQGRHAYLGTSVSGYPNLFLLLGPNILSGTTAVPTVLEAQLRHITASLTHLRRSGHAAMDVRPEIQDTHTTALRDALNTTVYSTDPAGYYFSPPGLNTFCWPWSTRRLRRQLHKFDPGAYTWHPPQHVTLPHQLRATVTRPDTSARH
ncbi:NAD(P)/FAD-dependent oxidoreductase [Kitasatospora aureofaciens]|uniref:flavin-containing monooxygenase n=1 Tax=Kitasatospora aureofaciens TaxID=1894 RepID=UPI001C45922A|nr:NAD(P)/FAD-dependent oxidoreductase [Kitasatospora aureofaciens]MBV6703008.1 NAD(P)/FAD-dependent oxidoreductase [Kitasatospora aureofaciens]